MRIKAVAFILTSYAKVREWLKSNDLKFTVYPEVRKDSLIVVTGLDNLILAYKKHPEAKFLAIDNIAQIVDTDLPVADANRLQSGVWVRRSKVDLSGLNTATKVKNKMRTRLAFLVAKQKANRKP